MIVVMKIKSSAKEISDVITRVKSDGYEAHLSEGEQRTIIGVVGESPTPLREENYSTMEGVEKVVRISAPYKLASRHFHPNDTHVPLNGSQMGGNKSSGDCRAVFRRKSGADYRSRLCGKRSRGDSFAGRRVQAAHIAIQLPGVW